MILSMSTPSPCWVLVADRHLCLAVGAQVGEDSGLADLGHSFGELVREHDRKRHELDGLARGVAKHHSLVTRAHPVELINVAVLRLI
jgi:hypothetical protein